MMSLRQSHHRVRARTSWRSKFGPVGWLIAALCLVQDNTRIWAASTPTVAIRGYGETAVIAGTTSSVVVIISNLSESRIRPALWYRVFQLGSSIRMPIDSERKPEMLELLPKQDILMTTSVYFPEVRAEVRFEVEWRDLNGTPVGRVLVTALPSAPLHPHSLRNEELALEVHATGGELNRLLQEQEGKLGTNPPAVSPARTVVLFWLEEESASTLREWSRLAKKRQAAGHPILWLTPQNKSDHGLSPILVQQRSPKAVTVFANHPAIAEFQESIFLQNRLRQLIKLAVSGPNQNYSIPELP